MGHMKAFKVTREMRAQASREYYEKRDRVFRLTESQRRQILNGTRYEQEPSTDDE
jgi:hypothetical protein